MDKKAILSDRVMQDAFDSMRRHLEDRHDIETLSYRESLADMLKVFIEAELVRKLGGNPDANLQEVKLATLVDKTQEHQRQMLIIERRLQVLEKIKQQPGELINSINEFPDVAGLRNQKVAQVPAQDAE